MPLIRHINYPVRYAEVCASRTLVQLFSAVLPLSVFLPAPVLRLLSSVAPGFKTTYRYFNIRKGLCISLDVFMYLTENIIENIRKGPPFL